MALSQFPALRSRSHPRASSARAPIITKSAHPHGPQIVTRRHPVLHQTVDDRLNLGALGEAQVLEGAATVTCPAGRGRGAGSPAQGVANATRSRRKWRSAIGTCALHDPDNHDETLTSYSGLHVVLSDMAVNSTREGGERK